MITPETEKARYGLFRAFYRGAVYTLSSDFLLLSSACPLLLQSDHCGLSRGNVIKQFARKTVCQSRHDKNTGQGHGLDEWT